MTGHYYFNTVISYGFYCISSWKFSHRTRFVHISSKHQYNRWQNGELQLGNMYRFLDYFHCPLPRSPKVVQRAANSSVILCCVRSVYVRFLVQRCMRLVLLYVEHFGFCVVPIRVEHRILGVIWSSVAEWKDYLFDL